MPYKQRTALITGATGGIGRALCGQFARHGYHLVLTARSKGKLSYLAASLRDAYGVNVHVIPADLAHPHTPSRIYHQLGIDGIQVDLLINNAGFGLGGYFDCQEPLEQARILQVNIAATTKLCRLFLPDMIARGSGAILNIASTGSFVPGPMNAIYCASKAYLLHLSEALREEVAGTGVTVCALCPGATFSNFAHRADMETTPLFRSYLLDPRQVAREAYTTLLDNKGVHVVGAPNKAAVFAIRFVPRKVSARVSGWIQTPRRCPSRRSATNLKY